MGQPLEIVGGPDTIRTCDLCLRRAALYPAELRVHATCENASYSAEPGAVQRPKWGIRRRRMGRCLAFAVNSPRLKPWRGGWSDG